MGVGKGGYELNRMWHHLYGNSREGILSSDLILMNSLDMMINTPDSVTVARGCRHQRGVPLETHDDGCFWGLIHLD